MKNLFKHASSSWVRYDRYEWKKDKNNKYYITPAPNAMPKIYDPLKDYKPMVLDALNIGLMIRKSSKRKVREAIMEFVSNYGLLGLMTALPTTPKFVDYKAVYLPVNHFIREMSTKEFGELLDQTDRNIRKKRMRLLKRIREELYEGLKDRKNLSLREKQFLERYEKSALTESEDAEDEEEKRCAG